MNSRRFKIWTVYCKCGQKLVRYLKKGPGRLLKIHRDRIVEDFTGIFMDESSPVGTDVYCPNCNQRIATIQLVKGKYVNKVNRGQLGDIKR